MRDIHPNFQIIWNDSVEFCHLHKHKLVDCFPGIAAFLCWLIATEYQMFLQYNEQKAYCTNENKNTIWRFDYMAGRPIYWHSIILIIHSKMEPNLPLFRCYQIENRHQLTNGWNGAIRFMGSGERGGDAVDSGRKGMKRASEVVFEEFRFRTPITNKKSQILSNEITPRITDTRIRWDRQSAGEHAEKNEWTKERMDGWVDGWTKEWMKGKRKTMNM